MRKALNMSELDRWWQLAFMLDNINQVVLHSYINVCERHCWSSLPVWHKHTQYVTICPQHISTWLFFHWIRIPRTAYFSYLDSSSEHIDNTFVCLKERDDLNKSKDWEEETNIYGNPTPAAILLVDVRASQKGLEISDNCSSKWIGHKDKVERRG